MSAANLKDRLVNSEVGEVFLELFEEEMKGFKPVNFENLVNDYSILCPIPTRPVRGVSFTMRLPSGDLEETRKAVQGFLLTRKLKFTLSKQKDNLLPLKDSQSKLSNDQNSSPLENGSTFTIDSEKDLFSCHITTVYGACDCSLISEGPYLLAVRKEDGIIQEILELQNIEVITTTFVFFF